MSLSPVMQQAVKFMQEHGNELVRHPGGFWSHEGWRHDGVSFGTSTADALVSRGVAERTEFKNGRGGTFPVRIRLVNQNQAEPAKP